MQKYLMLPIVGLALLSSSGCEKAEETQADRPALPLEPSFEIAEPADNRDARRRQHVRALENIHRVDWNAFVDGHFSDELKRTLSDDELEKLREDLVAGTKGVGSSMLMIEGDTFILKMGGSEGELDINFKVSENAPFGISDIAVGARLASDLLPKIADDNLDSVLDLAASEGFSGAVVVRKGGKAITSRGLGFADEEGEVAITPDTIFGTGSQPIDFTIALAHFAVQDGYLKLDDRVSKYLGKMPADKRDLTVGHLLDGRSGLPDFLDRETDWDADLAWLSRSDLVRRAKAAELRFAPGTRRGHSHAAYSLLAAVIEIATGKSYFDYLKEKVLDPADMSSTGMYGTTRGIALYRFAVGAGPKTFGNPNIPPNWGRASWLVIGSGGMYSSARDLMAFKVYMITAPAVPEAARKRFAARTVDSDGSNRGFERFEIRDGNDEVVLILTNSRDGDPVYRALAKRLQEWNFGRED